MTEREHFVAEVFLKGRKKIKMFILLTLHMTGVREVPVSCLFLYMRYQN